MTLVIQRIIGRVAIIDAAAGRVYACGAGFDMPPSGQHRAAYTYSDALDVVGWLNGHDQPLPTMKTREADRYDPVNRQGCRRNGHRKFRFFNTDSGYNPKRIGLAPLPDKE